MQAGGDRLLAAEGVATDGRRFTAAADLRYVGQYDDITVTLSPGEWHGRDLSGLLQRFHRMHDDLNGYASPGQPCEVTALHLTSAGVTEKRVMPRLPDTGTEAMPIGQRCIWIEERGGQYDALVYALAALRRGQVVQGPAIVELPGSTLVLMGGFEAAVDAAGNLLAYVASRRDLAARAQGVTP
jgi:N-methylhydantoinase A